MYIQISPFDTPRLCHCSVSLDPSSVPIAHSQWRVSGRRKEQHARFFRGELFANLTRVSLSLDELQREDRSSCPILVPSRECSCPHWTRDDRDKSNFVSAVPENPLQFSLPNFPSFFFSTRLSPQRGANQDTGARDKRRDSRVCSSVSRTRPTARDSLDSAVREREKLVWIPGSRSRVAVFVTIVKRSDGFHDRFWENSQRVALFEVGSADFYRLIRCVQRVYK